VFLAFPVPDGRAVDAVAAARTLGIAGLSVTMPHKAAIIPALDEVTPTAATLGAVNCVHRQGDVLIGDSTDGPGFLDALRQDEGFDPAGRRCVVLGAGGAARAVVHALAEAGAVEVVVINRTADRGAQAAALAGAVGRTGDARTCVPAADLVVNATSVGMGATIVTLDGGHPAVPLPVDADLLHEGQVVVDLVYHPIRTPFLEAARERGAVGVTGLGMLIHQAAHAFRRWTGENPPLEVMSAAALAALAARE
jgi:shikimate dehydrogenase